MNNHQLPITKWFLGLCLVIGGWLLVIPNAQAAQVSLSGYAWSETIGWISFRDTSPIVYGVSVDADTGLMSGYAWSEIMGWLSFNQSELSGCPSGTCRAFFDTGASEMSGWAKFLSNGEWVHLANNNNYEVTYDDQSLEFDGYSWGDTVAGWISWNGPNYQVVSDTPIVEPVWFCIANCSDDVEGGGGAGGGGGGGGNLNDIDDVEVQKGGVDQYGQTQVRLSYTSGGTQPVWLEVSDLPSGVSASASPNPCELGPDGPGNADCESTITVTVEPEAPSGVHTLTVTVTPQYSGSAVSDEFDLIITDAVALTVECEASGNPPYEVGETVTWTATASIGTPPYTFEFWSGNVPDGANINVNPTTGSYSTTGSKAALGKFRDSKGVTATCPANPINVTVDPNFEEF